MGKFKHKKTYVVWKGRKPGIYDSWDECRAQTDFYPGAIFKSFVTRDEAEEAFGNKPWLPKPAYIKAMKEEQKSLGKDPVSIFCDGGCDPNPGPSGTGMAVYKSGHIFEHWMGHHEPEGTNNRAELLGMQEAINYIIPLVDQGIVTPAKPAVIYCDSQYAINCLTKWSLGWKKNGWKTKEGNPVQNREIIESSASNLRAMRNAVEVRKIKAHVGIAGNELADQLAGLARVKKIQTWTRTYSVKASGFA